MTVIEDRGSRPPDNPQSDALMGLRSVKSTTRLNQINQIRANGVGDHISLPQLVVCGDQSAGKSSVLEGITGIPFPRQDGVCTKFATEISLRHDLNSSSITATIVPHSSRSATDKENFRAYRRVLSGFSELSSVISDASKLMGIRGHGGLEDGPAFVSDRLRIEVVGDTGLHLTVVDLPGLIAVASDEQTDEDVCVVADLVDSYLASSRTIILAVVQANNDIANQGIIQRARNFDKKGQRTVGIITKPDLINEGTESRIALLAKNKDTTKLKLGFFLLKNPTPSQLSAGISLQERRREELSFFQSERWKEQQLDMDRVGIENLRIFLQDLHDKHIERELPKVRSDLKQLLNSSENVLVGLGTERPSIGHMRMFLTRLSMSFHAITRAALDGNYHEGDIDFFDGYTEGRLSTRLRAEVHGLNTKFATQMREGGQKRKVSESKAMESLPKNDSGSDLESSLKSQKSQLLVSKKELDAWVKKVYIRSRGRELPGNYNHVLLSELFHEQSSPWEAIASKHVMQTFQLTRDFVEHALRRVVGEESVRVSIEQVTGEMLESYKILADAELKKLIKDERLQPITYNHYYTDNIQRARQDSLQKSIKDTMKDVVDEDWNGKFHVSNNSYDAEKLIASLQKRVLVNMEEQACSEALAGLNAYYKVAMKTFVDNVCRQVIERHLLSNLAEIFSPTIVLGFSDETLIRIASEPHGQKERRAALENLVKGLKDSLIELQK